jgi:hypothetical protein
MTANVIMFSNPTVKVYHALPPSRSDISEIIAFVFQGPAQPTEFDIKRTPMLVRRNVVKDALEWLKLNHADYKDLQISLENLNDYPLAGVPVNVEYTKSDPVSGNRIVSAMSVFNDEFKEGTTDGPCPFTVHGLTSSEFENMSMDRLKQEHCTIFLREDRWVSVMIQSHNLCMTIHRFIPKCFLGFSPMGVEELAKNAILEKSLRLFTNKIFSCIMTNVFKPIFISL